jgi:hypothetical protein
MGFFSFLKYTFIIFAAQLATSSGAPFENHCPIHRSEDNIKMDLGEIGWGDMDWIDLAWDRDQWMAPVNTVMNLRIP